MWFVLKFHANYGINSGQKGIADTCDSRAVAPWWKSVHAGRLTFMRLTWPHCDLLGKYDSMNLQMLFISSPNRYFPTKCPWNVLCSDNDFQYFHLKLALCGSSRSKSGNWCTTTRKPRCISKVNGVKTKINRIGFASKTISVSALIMKCFINLLW